MLALFGVNINMKNLDKLLKNKFKNFCINVHEDLKDELRKPRFEEGFIGRKTQKSSGEIVEESRAIYDTGELSDSQELLIKNFKGTIAYTADHAPEVYFIDGGGRPWIERYIQEQGKDSFRLKFKES